MLHVPNSQDRRRTPSVRVLLADDHSLYAETLEMLLSLDDRIEVVGRAASGAEAIALTVGLRPDVVLMDVHMPCLNGITATRTLNSLLPGIRVVMLSSSAAVEDIERARDAGACAYLTKDAEGPTIAEEVVRACSSDRRSLNHLCAA
ncbi:MAG: two-component system, NarL family, response regulator LiaR [Gaiellaceae bacterium]|nr:two-component system, NarL family, response regulator LiaR [Gaiellaceae bacterium]